MKQTPRSVAEHRERILAKVQPTDRITASPLSAVGLTLLEPARAKCPVPPFTNSSMDGFAVRFADTATASNTAPVALEVVADLPAGTALDPEFKAGQAVRIMTGARVPQAADTVVPFEDTAGGLADSLGTISVEVAPRELGANVRYAGEDIEIGSIVLEPGVEIGVRQAASLVATGVEEVTVAARPRVAVLSTGSELVPAGTPLGPAQIPDTNSNLLAGFARAAGAEIVFAGSVPDDAEALAERVDRLLSKGVDTICFSGGVSAGAYEPVRDALGRSGQMEFGHVTMQPGKPQGFGVSDDGCLLFGLPGNPISSTVSFEVFVRPALLAMQGRTQIIRPRLQVRASEGWDSPVGREQYVPIVFNQSDPTAWTVAPATARGSQSHLIGTLGLADGLAIVPAEATRIEVGELVEVVLLP